MATRAASGLAVRRPCCTICGSTRIFARDRILDVALDRLVREEVIHPLLERDVVVLAEGHRAREHDRAVRAGEHTGLHPDRAASVREQDPRRPASGGRSGRVGRRGERGDGRLIYRSPPPDVEIPEVTLTERVLGPGGPLRDSSLRDGSAVITGHVVASLARNLLATSFEVQDSDTAAEVKQTAVMRISLERASAKLRNGPPGDDEEKRKFVLAVVHAGLKLTLAGTYDFDAGLLDFDGDTVDMTKDVLVHGEVGSPRPRPEGDDDKGQDQQPTLHADTPRPARVAPGRQLSPRRRTERKGGSMAGE